MRAVRIAGADPTPLGAPPDWNPETDGHCGALFIRRDVEGGVAFMKSAWEVEAVEASMLFAGARLVLGVAGDRHPVVNLSTTELPADFEPVVTARRISSLDGKPLVRVEMLYPYGGGSRGFVEVHVDGTLADAISTGVTLIEALARRNGWVE